MTLAMYTTYSTTIAIKYCALPPCTAVGKQILERHHGELKEAIASGTVEDSKAVGLLDQWVIEGKFSEEEALVLSCDMLAAGMDTVRMCGHVEERVCGRSLISPLD